jgi:hypothetical protein
MNPLPTVKVAEATTAAALAKTDAGASANDDAAAEIAAATRNPLWIIAIAMACFFAVVFAVMTLDTEPPRFTQSASPASTPVAARSEAARPDAETLLSVAGRQQPDPAGQELRRE